VRMPKYMSPTSLKMWMTDRKQYFMNYLADPRPPRPPQTVPMAVGSAFDAYVKSFIVQKLNGSVDPAFEFTTIFETQVETQNRDRALADGKHVFEHYQKCGALQDIIIDLEGAVGRPRFETAIEGFVSSVSIAIGDVPMLGKPDIYFLTKKGGRVIFDWKVNGYYSARAISPSPGYTRIRTLDAESGRSHPKAMVMDHNGLKISASHPLCGVNKDWAAQLAIYAWLLGEDVGSNFIVAIDQIACGPDNVGGKHMRVAQHRSIVSEGFQKATFEAAHKAWYQLQTGHIFDDLSREDSDRQCELLQRMAEVPADPDFDDLFR
jgi:hypothetical protein